MRPNRTFWRIFGFIWLIASVCGFFLIASDISEGKGFNPVSLITPVLYFAFSVVCFISVRLCGGVFFSQRIDNLLLSDVKKPGKFPRRIVLGIAAICFVTAMFVLSLIVIEDPLREGGPGFLTPMLVALLGISAVCFGAYLFTRPRARDKAEKGE